MSGNVVAEMARVTCEEYYVEGLVTYYWAGEEEEEPAPEPEPEPESGPTWAEMHPWSTRGAR
jgi:hypothetical protein